METDKAENFDYDNFAYDLNVNRIITIVWARVKCD